MPDVADRNKKNAMAFYDLMFNQNRPDEAVERYVGDVYTRISDLVVVPYR